MKIINATELAGLDNQHGSTRFYFDAELTHLEEVVEKEKTFIITDENVFAAQRSTFTGWKTIVIKAGEQYKQQAAVDDIIRQLIEMKADRTSIIVGVGGGVVTDIAGYAACVYMRGIRFGFVPTTILAMVDASIGGKNGVDVGVYKNLVGMIKQPEFLLYDYSLLSTLPRAEWINGFAEIIKHACIKDAALFDLLEQNSLDGFVQNKAMLASLVEANVNIKNAVVAKDPYEKGDRKLLNFGHTLGHAIENIYQLPHGHAISVGMVIAAGFSQQLNQLSPAATQRITQLLKQYGLTVQVAFDREKIWEVLRMDKKRVSDHINFILLNSIGDAVIRPIALGQLEQLIEQSMPVQAGA